MENRFVPLRPALPTTERSPANASPPTPDGPEVKRHRVGVSVACDACRKRKIRCDGTRPVCSACRRRAERCVYRNETYLTKEAARLVTEIIHLLSAMPQEEVYRVLKVLKTESDAAIVLSVLRGGMNSKQRPSDLAVTTAIMEQSFISLELEVQNPVAYPTLPPIHVDVHDEDAYQRLTQSRLENTATSAELQRKRGKETWKTELSISYRDATPDGLPLSQRQSPYRDAAASMDGPSIGGPSSSTGQQHGFHSNLCDPRLRDMDIGYWTGVQINNGLAARVISLYLETDHPLLGHFDPDLFVSDLVYKRHEYCSRLLVNALLYWACQMYSSIDHRTDALANECCTEAENLWKTERDFDSIPNIAGAQFLSLAYLGQGKDHAVLTYLAEASNMGTRMGLFGVEGYGIEQRLGKMGADARSAYIHAAWGAFNWIVLISTFYHQPGIECPRHMPQVPYPREEDGEIQNRPSAHYMGRTLPHLCRFWNIMHEVCMVYYSDTSVAWGDSNIRLLQFAEYKFRELLAWSNSLPSGLARDDHNTHHIMVLHLWFHAAILDIFRPFVGNRAPQKRRLKTFSNPSSSPDAVYGASVNQLKRLIIVYRMNYRSSAYTILWHTALTYVANAVLQKTGEDGWFFYFLLCVYGYEGLRRSWRVTEAITRGLLSMALRNGNISSQTARQILRDLQNNGFGYTPGKIQATFMVDLDLAMSDPSSATVERLADSFEENAAFKDYTNIFDGTGMADGVGSHGA